MARRLAQQWLAEGSELIPIRHLSIDLDEPLDGWEQVLLERGVEIVDDDLGRRCVRREVLGDLLREQRERLARIAAEDAARASAAMAPILSGLPALEDGPAMAAVMAADPSYQTPQAEFGRPRPDFLAEELEAGQRKLAAERAAIAERKKKHDETR